MIKRADSIESCLNDLGAVVQHLRDRNVDTMNQRAWLALDLTMPQVKVLFSTLRAGRLKASAIAELLSVGPSAVTPVVDALVDKKLVRREPDGDDRRVIWIVPTAQGRTLLERLLGTGRDSLAAVLETLSPTELLEAQRGLAVLAAAVKRSQEAP
jgi:DNA-binding MarR family transcriptional regulator